jgi:hypothetical protein
VPLLVVAEEEEGEVKEVLEVVPLKQVPHLSPFLMSTYFHSVLVLSDIPIVQYFVVLGNMYPVVRYVIYS